MNPKISITVDAKNKAVATLTGLVTVGAKVDVEVRGLDASLVPDWGADDAFAGKSLRFRVVDGCGRDLVRFPLVCKVDGLFDGDKWTVTGDGAFVTQAETASSPVVNFNTDGLRKEFSGVAFNDSLEFGVILDSIVDDAQYAVGRMKVRQWSACPTDDPTILPDWRMTLCRLRADLAEVEQIKTDAESAKDAAVSAKDESVDAKNAAQSLADAALSYKNSALSSAESASGSASSAGSSASSASESAADASESAEQAAAQVSKYPRIDVETNHWLVWNAEEGRFVDTGISAIGPKGDPGDDGESPHVGQNGNWFVGSVDTGVKAQGPKGDKGAPGEPGKKGDGVPDGGSPGQVLKKTSSGTEWADEQGGEGKRDKDDLRVFRANWETEPSDALGEGAYIKFFDDGTHLGWGVFFKNYSLSDPASSVKGDKSSTELSWSYGEGDPGAIKKSFTARRGAGFLPINGENISSTSAESGIAKINKGGVLTPAFPSDIPGLEDKADSSDVETYIITGAVDGGVTVDINGETVTMFADLFEKCKTGRAVLYGQATTVETGYAFYTAASVTDSIIQFQVSGMLYDKSNIRYGMYVRRIKIVPRANGGLLVDDSGLEGPFASKSDTYAKGKQDDGSPADAELHDFFTKSDTFATDHKLKNAALEDSVNALIDYKVGDVNAVLAAALDGTEVS